jgi:hypothetical protein
MTFTVIFVLAAASATVSLNVGDKLPIVTPSDETLALRHVAWRRRTIALAELLR